MHQNELFVQERKKGIFGYAIATLLVTMWCVVLFVFHKVIQSKGPTCVTVKYYGHMAL